MPILPVMSDKYFYQYLWFRNANKLLFCFEENKTYESQGSNMANP